MTKTLKSLSDLRISEDIYYREFARNLVDSVIAKRSNAVTVHIAGESYPKIKKQEGFRVAQILANT